MTTGADWLDSARRLVDALRPEPSEAAGTPTAEGAHGADCRWCPVCQAAAVVRGERPEVTAALADILTTTAAALRTFAGEQPAPADAAAPQDDPGDEPPAVQRIEIA
jgi:hypothetical protein